MLAPLLFIIFISDLAHSLSQYQVTLKTFADDFKLYSVVDSDRNIDNLQFAIDTIYDWSNTWQVPIATNKCHVMDVGSAHKLGEFCPNTLAGNELNFVTSAKDLGVLIDSNLTFSPHISEITVKAKIRCLLSFKVFATRNTQYLVNVF